MGYDVGGMAVFAVLSLIERQEGHEALDAAIKSTYPNDHFPLAPGGWLLRSDGNAKEVSEKLGIMGGTLGNAVVFGVSGYFGLANNTVWEWLALKSTLVVGTDAPVKHD
jgi:hypothetical protein